MSLSLKKAKAEFSLPGARLMVTHTSKGISVFGILGGQGGYGGLVSDQVAAQLLKDFDTEESDDGLFPNNPQSWRIRKST